MKKLVCSFFILGWISSLAQSDFRAPSYPLITHDPYFSIWMDHENPTRSEAKHWTNTEMPIRSMIRIDGETYRLMGKSPAYVQAASHVRTELTATRTIYHFEQDGVRIQLSFLSPLLVDDMDVVARPLSYVSWTVASNDARNHQVKIYFDVSGYATINHRGQKVTWERSERKGMNILKMGSQDQPVLKKSGDDVRIDWGYLYLAGNAERTYIGRNEWAMDAFASLKSFPEENLQDQDHRFINYEPVVAMTLDAAVSSDQPTEKHLMVAYDDIYSVEYFGEKLEGYWKKKFSTMDELLALAEEEYAIIKNRCIEFDQEIDEKATELGGEEYATIVDLAHRQAMAAHKIVKGENGAPLCFSKENASNGSMGTVDVFYPASPYFLYLNTTLIKAQTTPIFDYAESGRWPWPYAPHDIGKYPLGNGQTYGGGEKTEDRQMPVEECGNMLILAGAISKVDGNTDYADKYWKILTRWAEYLKEKGFDPDNQLCTDDFAGHLAHNANLSVKAMMGIASYALLLEMKGQKKEAKHWMKLARSMVNDWMEAADDGDHYKLAFDQPGSWSQKYNMVWDDLLGFNLFDEQIEDTEITHYLSVQNRYGLPLDSRETYTKLDWIVWTASLANTNEAFRQLIHPVYVWLNETPDRVPMSDWYWTKSGEVRGFRARSVVGGVYIELLKDKLATK